MMASVERLQWTGRAWRQCERRQEQRGIMGAVSLRPSWIHVEPNCVGPFDLNDLRVVNDNLDRAESDLLQSLPE